MPLFELPMELDDHTEGNGETVISFLIGEEARGLRNINHNKSRLELPHQQHIRNRTKDTLQEEFYC